MVISIWFFKVCLFNPFWPIDKLAKNKVKYPYRPIFLFFIFHIVEISISCIIINLILVLVHRQQLATAWQRTLLRLCEENWQWVITVFVQQISQTTIEPCGRTAKQAINVMQQNLFLRIRDCISEKQFQWIALSKSGILTTYENQASSLVLISRKTRLLWVKNKVIWGLSNHPSRNRIVLSHLEKLPNENEDKTKTKMTQSFNQYSENEIKIWRQNILNQFNRVSSSCLCSHFLISLISTILRLMKTRLKSVFTDYGLTRRGIEKGTSSVPPYSALSLSYFFYFVVYPVLT